MTIFHKADGNFFCPPDVAIAYGEGDAAKGLGQFERWLDYSISHLAEIRGVLWYAVHGGKMLDIGCGHGLLTLMAARITGVLSVSIVDGDRAAEQRQGFHEDVKPWNDVRLAGKTLKGNLPDIVEVAEFTPGTFTRFGWQNEIDLVISTKSWGHHYPVGEYIEEVLRAIAPGGHLIIDVRKGTTGRDELLAAGFISAKQIGGTEKCDRYWMQRARDL